MMAIKQRVMIQPGGLIEVRSPEFPSGEQAEVIVLLDAVASGEAGAANLDAEWAKLRRHAGAMDSGDPNSSDNDRIDADLARIFHPLPELWLCGLAQGYSGGIAEHVRSISGPRVCSLMSSIHRSSRVRRCWMPLLHPLSVMISDRNTSRIGNDSLR
jgi:hypothetical protein